ncbi:hypothetical protein [Alkaliphilus sp. B6464]|uniref:hypothetical protein n=1 Tax=Alkaliphilus sp. B6464 TaxID=2731219 RepID=UPI001BA5F856|nr:hypothetical protein [Alkaliphilus sp. B6464]QUH22207.1 hypothetical protein HYG84_20075 [Alkaliphilus sp. B6464]
MFSLKINKDLVEKCIEGITIEEGDVLILEYVGWDGRTVVEKEKLTIKSIEHYNADLFIVTFVEANGDYALSLNQLIRFKINS